MIETAATRKKWELTFSVQSRAFFSMPMGTEEEPDQQPCQRHGQLRPVYPGCFEGEGRWAKYSDSKRGSDCVHLMCIRPGISLETELSFKNSFTSLLSKDINMAKRCSQTSLASSKTIVRESNKPVHAASTDTGLASPFSLSGGTTLQNSSSDVYIRSDVSITDTRVPHKPS